MQFLLRLPHHFLHVPDVITVIQSDHTVSVLPIFHTGLPDSLDVRCRQSQRSRVTDEAPFTHKR
jgi:N-dimethylarginine dimethylaminohydrolase